MKVRAIGDSTLFFPLAEGEEVVVGGIYEVVDGAATLVTDAPTGNIVGVCVGGNALELGKVMLDINPLSVFEEAYEEAPVLGEIVDGCKLVVKVKEGKFEYVIKVAPAAAEEL